MVHCPDHPGTQANGYVAEHRLVLERLLGRYLRPGEKVRHRNGDRSDNRPENLELIPCKPLEERFWEKVARGDGCWLWNGRRLRQGYGVFWVSRKPLLAHRVAYQLAAGPIPEGLCVCHCCDNPPCVKPSHLFLGTQQDNMDDMKAKGRGPAKLSAKDLEEVRRLQGAGLTQQAIAAHFGVHVGTVQRAAPVGSTKGERNGRAKLTTESVRALRWRALAGEGSAALADDYGVSKGAVQKVMAGRTWGHVSWFAYADIQAALSSNVQLLFGG